jgi:hypothetical protein
MPRGIPGSGPNAGRGKGRKTKSHTLADIAARSGGGQQASDGQTATGSAAPAAPPPAAASTGRGRGGKGRAVREQGSQDECSSRHRRSRSAGWQRPAAGRSGRRSRQDGQRRFDRRGSADGRQRREDRGHGGSGSRRSSAAVRSVPVRGARNCREDGRLDCRSVVPDPRRSEPGQCSRGGS